MLMSPADTSYAARSGEAVETLPVSTSDDVEAVVAAAAAAAPLLAATTADERAGWLGAVAEALEAPAAAAELVAVADRETGLGEARLSGELGRAAQQLRFYAGVAQEGSWLAATVDHASEATDTAPDLRRMRVPLGTVAVLGASNFPFGFGTLGHDTASALAAGCPVVAKAHPAHPATGRLLGRVARDALTGAGAPQGTFGLVSGFTAGEQLVTADAVAAVAFTGSQRGGLALWRLANGRDRAIPVFAEMGTVNPAVMTSGAVGRLDEVVTGFVGSFTLGMGQFCTKPGLLLAPAGHDVPARVAAALAAAAPQGWLLTEPIATAYAAGVADLVAAGATVLGQTPSPGEGWAAPATVLAAPSGALARGSRLLEECFGPVALVVEYADEADLHRILGILPGALAGTVLSGGPEDPEVTGHVAALAASVGRVIVDGWPTGVALGWAQHHGGPWPSTTVPSATSVGAAALDRFTRPTTWQSVPDQALPPALQEANPWRIPRRVDGVPEAPEGPA